MHKSRFIIGIDLGTTNIAVTFVDTYEKERGIRLFRIPQFIAPGEVNESELLPSFCFFPDKKLLPDNSMNLPWMNKMDYAVGVYGRDYGSAIPNRFVSSVKSWLCHAGVNRKGKMLPWGSQLENILKSPVEITSYYLDHIRKSWDHKFSKIKDIDGNSCNLIDQQVVITVPASFDETARELTIESANKAGYKNICLLEEPLAAFYSWLDNNGADWEKIIHPGENILIIDVGGGTCDFSMIEMNNDGVLSRTATGSHLLLGGDNIDIAIARKIEQRWNIKLSSGEWLTLCQKTREAKEKILSSDIDEIDVVLLSQGSSIVGNIKKHILKRSFLEELIIDGFFSKIPKNSDAPVKKSGIQTMGLPYEPDPILTKHLLHFLKYALKVSQINSTEISSDSLLKPDKILFNGGTMIPEIVRKQIIDVVTDWFLDGKVIQELQSKDFSLAVAYGASYYARTKRGEGVKVKSGTALSYFLKVSSGSENSDNYVCVMPRGTDENARIVTPKNFKLGANKKVQFPLFSTATRLNDTTGSMLNTDEELSFVSSLQCVLRFGKTVEKEIKAKIVSELTETGILKIWLESKESNHKWPLNFDIRLLSVEDSIDSSDNSIVLDAGQVSDVCKMITDTFNSNSDDYVSIIKRMEKSLELSKNKWPLHVLRSFADSLLSIPYETLIIPKKEAKWLNLCGFCLRPGFGDPEDELRLRKIWKLWFKGMNNPNNSQVVADRWVFWRRVVAGLKSGHQKSIYQALYKVISPKGVYANKIKSGIQPKTEMWRCMGSLELLPSAQKTTLGKLLTSRKTRLESFEYWVLARLGARHLFKAPTNHVLPAKTVINWLESLIDTNTPKGVLQDKLFTVFRLAALTGDRSIDIEPQILTKSLEFLKNNNAPAQWSNHLQNVKKESILEQSRILGDSMPLGLKIEEID